MVVFGASGDLCTRKLLPALRALARRGELPGGFSLVGVARTVFDDDQFRSFARSRSAAGRTRRRCDRLVPSASSLARTRRSSIPGRAGTWATARRA